MQFPSFAVSTGVRCGRLVTETPCGHCRQIYQELPSAGAIRVIVTKHGVDCSLASLLPYSLSLSGLCYP